MCERDRVEPASASRLSRDCSRLADPHADRMAAAARRQASTALDEDGRLWITAGRDLLLARPA